MQHILLTGFEPFAGATVNPSWQAVSRLQGWQPDEETIVQTLQLPCVFSQSLQVLSAAIEQYAPVLVIAVGQAGGRHAFSLEKVAINYDDARIPDNLAQQPKGEPVHATGPAAYFSTLPVKRIAQELRNQGIPAEVSFSAGTFVCNHVFYGLMHQLEQQPRLTTHERPRGGFIHIPYSPEQASQLAAASMDIALVIQALQISIELSLQNQDDLQICAGRLD